MEVKIDNFSFAPATLTVAAGTTVTWTNRDDIPHRGQARMIRRRSSPEYSIRMKSSPSPSASRVHLPTFARFIRR